MVIFKQKSIDFCGLVLNRAC